MNNFIKQLSIFFLITFSSYTFAIANVSCKNLDNLESKINDRLVILQQEQVEEGFFYDVIQNSIPLKKITSFCEFLLAEKDNNILILYRNESLFDFYSGDILLSLSEKNYSLYENTLHVFLINEKKPSISLNTYFNRKIETIENVSRINFISYSYDPVDAQIREIEIEKIDNFLNNSFSVNFLKIRNLYLESQSNSIDKNKSIKTIEVLWRIFVVGKYLASTIHTILIWNPHEKITRDSFRSSFIESKKELEKNVWTAIIITLALLFTVIPLVTKILFGIIKGLDRLVGIIINPILLGIEDLKKDRRKNEAE